jgi:hypothetical protein
VTLHDYYYVSMRVGFVVGLVPIVVVVIFVLLRFPFLRIFVIQIKLNDLDIVQALCIFPLPTLCSIRPRKSTR